MRARDYDWKRCENCEGEGHVVNWLTMGHEVPASRKRICPEERPEDPAVATNVRVCPECKGHGTYAYDDDGRQLSPADFG